jgi:transcriptional regulator with XRE-family HTH domain
MIDNDNMKQLAKARQKKGWTQKEIEEFAKRRSRELKEISENVDEPDYLASGTQKNIKEICEDDEKDDSTNA